MVFILNPPSVYFRDTESKKMAGGGVVPCFFKTVVTVHVFPVDTEPREKEGKHFALFLL